MNNIPEKYVSKIQAVELLRPGVVKIPYALNEKRWDIIIYNENNGFKIRINKYTNNIRKKIKDKEASLPKRKTNSIEKNKTVFIKELGIILDTYVGTNRPKILQKAEDAYTLLMEEERGMKINETAKKIYNIVGNNIPKEAKELLKKAKEFFGNKTLEESKIFVNKAKKNPRKKEVFKKMLIIASIIGITGAGVMGLRKLGNYRTKQNTDEKTTKEIAISDKQKNNNIPSDTIHRNDHISQKNSKQNIKSEETKKEPIENIKSIPKEKKQTINNIKNTTEEDIFTIIEKPDPNIDPDRYNNRKCLSITEKNIVKDLYQKLITTNNEYEIKTIIYEIRDFRILRGLRDILVKRIIIDKKKKKEVIYLQNISQKTVKQEYDLINQTIINTQNIVEKYSLEPNNFTIISIQGNDNASNMDNQSGDIEVHFTLKNNKEKIGTISFNNNGILTTPTITQNNKTYTVSQNGTNIYITENQLTSN